MGRKGGDLSPGVASDRFAGYDWSIDNVDPTHGTKGTLMLGVPATTDFDLKFRLLGIPVRVHPLFWALAAFLGWSSRSGGEVVVWVACVFVSVLVHEFGHGLTARALSAQSPSIVLYGMGGLCVYDREHRSPWRRLVIILMGPGAGFLLFGLVAVAGTLILGIAPFRLAIVHEPPRWAFSSPLIWAAYSDLLLINLFWGIFNLLPIYPLDGGQVSHTLLSMNNRREGPKRCYIVSIGVAALLAVYLYRQEQTVNALIVGYLGLINFQYYQAAQFQSRHGDSFESDDDWWRR